MRIDDRLSQLRLTPEQYLFASCWHNMAHAFSLDSYRVRAINPANGLRELHRMLAPPANKDDFTLVAEELHVLLKADPILKFMPFSEATSELIDLLPRSIADGGKKFEANKPLILAFSTELLRHIEAGYVNAIFSALESALITDVDALPPNERNTHIQTLIGNLLSTLLDQGASVESLFQLYRQVICGTKPGKLYVFKRRFSLLVKLVTQAPSKFSVIFSIDNVSKPETFPNQIGTVSFLLDPPNLETPTPPVARYLAIHPKRIFAKIEVETKDYRTAGTNAYATINSILDLVRFEYERERLHLPDEFVITSGAPDNVYRIFPIPKVVPNPAPLVDAAGLHEFIQSVNELMINQTFQDDGRRRVQSAFRLYRIGSDTHIFENKLINWWTAIEYLVKGSNSSSGIGNTVENTLAPVLCLGYINKLILSFRNALVDVKAQLNDPVTGDPIQLRDLRPSELYQLFKNPVQHAQLLVAATDPFLKQKLQEFLNALVTPKAIESLLKSHEKRLRWQIQRLYRARCDIVHSAERIVNAALLCANLEFYLKVTLAALLRTLSRIPNISGPKEFFDRQIYSYEKLIFDLNANSEKLLLELLDK